MSDMYQTARGPAQQDRGAADAGGSQMLEDTGMDAAVGHAVEFEAAYAELEECVAVLEQGGLTLEAALARFEDGMRLSARCAAILDEADLRVTRLLGSGDDEDDEPAF
jgi:exodeoxyribonuclease VII small subunit